MIFVLNNICHNLIMQESPFDLKHVMTPEPTVYWLPEFDLTFDYQHVLSGGHWLSSKHMSAVHTLLSILSKMVYKNFATKQQLQMTIRQQGLHPNYSNHCSCNAGQLVQRSTSHFTIVCSYRVGLLCCSICRGSVRPWHTMLQPITDETSSSALPGAWCHFTIPWVYPTKGKMKKMPSMNDNGLYGAMVTPGLPQHPRCCFLRSVVCVDLQWLWRANVRDKYGQQAHKFWFNDNNVTL